MADPPDKIVGWKSIGGYFGHDRSTAIRWVRNRGMPVHHVPGGKIASVYALRSELDAWLKDGDDHADSPVDGHSKQVPVKHPVTPKRSRNNWTARELGLVLAFSAVIIAALFLGVWRNSDEGAAATVTQPGLVERLPDDPEARSIYLSARSNWARRRSDTIDRAIEEFGQVISISPDFGPAYASLADAYILAREFGRLPDKTAFPRAAAAAEVAIRLDPNLAAAHRANGFVQYWWQNDPVAAGKSFREAIALAPDDAQSHHWYGTALTDNGQFSAALRELNAARTINPESPAIASDYGFLLWAAGREQEAMVVLAQVEKEHGDFAAPYDCYRYIYLAERNIPAYLSTMSRLAQMRNEPALKIQVNREMAAYRAGGISRLAPTMVNDALAARASGLADRVWPVSIATAASDRSTVVRLLREADMNKERWGSVGQLARVAAYWRDDDEITQLIGRRRPLPMEPQPSSRGGGRTIPPFATLCRIPRAPPLRTLSIVAKGRRDQLETRRPVIASEGYKP